MTNGCLYMRGGPLTTTELSSERNPSMVASSALGCPMRAQGRRCEAAATPSL